MTCFTQEHSLTCGLTNQLFELATCLAISAKLGAKQFILPSICSDGNWGLCYCSKSQQYSTFFNLQRMKWLAKERFGITIYEYEESQTYLQDVSEELFRLQDNTLYLKPLSEAAEIIYDMSTKKKNYLEHNVLNIGFAWGRWKGDKFEEDMLYLTFFDLFYPSMAVKRVIDDWAWKTKHFDSNGPLIVIHNQIPTSEGIYPGCQRTEINDYVSLITREMSLGKKTRVLLIGSGFELKTSESLRLSELSSAHSIHVYSQSDIMRITADHQLHNSLAAFWIAIEADHFIATTCESQFLSHIVTIRMLLGRPVCSLTDVTKSIHPNAYPSKFKNNGEYNGRVPYRFPHPYQGSLYTLEKCKFPLQNRIL